MKVILAVLICFFYVTDIKASNIKMYGKEEYGYEQPKYIESYALEDSRKIFRIEALADSDAFPLSSKIQGSVFNKIFLDLEKEEKIQISLQYRKGDYQESVDNFERGNQAYLEGITARFAVSYEEYPYSKNSYIYPAFFENKVHILMSKNNKLSFQGRDTLKKYKGVYVKKDKFPQYILKQFNDLGIVETRTYDEALEKLLTGKIDYVVASYYPSIIEVYKKGVRDFVSYSTKPAWKIALFLRGLPSLMKDEHLQKLEKYLKSEHYKKIRDEAFEELVAIYEQNTQGVLPPQYVGDKEKSENSEKNNDK